MGVTVVAFAQDPVELLPEHGHPLWGEPEPARGLSDQAQTAQRRLVALRTHAVVLELHQGAQLRRVEAVDSGHQLLFAQEGILGQNYKTAKGHPEQPALVMGLSLAPHRLWYDNVGERWGATTAQGRPFDLCVGSTEACRRTCLVFTGQNAADPTTT